MGGKKQVGKVTIGSTDDPKHPDGSYRSVGRKDSNDHTTFVYDSDGKLKERKQKDKKCKGGLFNDHSD
jgi:hypothetical protein